MRMSTILSVLFVATLGTPAFSQAPPAKPEPVTIQIKESIRLKTDLALLDDSGLTSGTIFGADLKGVSGCFIFKDEVRVDLSSQDFLKDSKLDKCTYLPEGTILPAGTEIAAGSCLTIDKTYKLPRALVTVGLKKIQPGDYGVLKTEDVAIDGILQKAKVTKAEANAAIALSIAKKLENDLNQTQEDLKKLKTNAAQVINNLNAVASDAEGKAARAEAQASTAKSMAQKAIDEAQAAKALAGAVDSKLSAAINDFAAAQKALAETQKVAPPATLPPAPTTQLYAFPAGTPAETTHGGETYVRQPCGNYKKKV